IPNQGTARLLARAPKLGDADGRDCRRRRSGEPLMLVLAKRRFALVDGRWSDFEAHRREWQTDDLRDEGDERCTDGVCRDAARNAYGEMVDEVLFGPAQGVHDGETAAGH